MKYYIIGNGGFAKEVLFLTKVVFKAEKEFGGFIELNPEAETVLCMGEHYPVIDENEFLAEFDTNSEIYIGLGNPKIISKIIPLYQRFTFPNLIHPSAVGHFQSIVLGDGNIITAGCILTVDINIGSYNVLNLHTTIGHDSTIGNCNVFNPGANISGSTVIGDVNLFGTNCTVLQGVTIENNSTVGGASLVNKNVPSNTVVVGVPAKPLVKNG